MIVILNVILDSHSLLGNYASMNAECNVVFCMYILLSCCWSELIIQTFQLDLRQGIQINIYCCCCCCCSIIVIVVVTILLLLLLLHAIFFYRSQ